MKDFLETRTVPSGPWRWPIDLEKYDRTPDLTVDEIAELHIVMNRFRNNQYPRLPSASWQQLDRFVTPIVDVLNWSTTTKGIYTHMLHIFIREMYQSRRSIWIWSPDDWGRIIKQSQSQSVSPEGKIGGVWYKNHLFAIGYLLTGFSDFSNIHRLFTTQFADKLFGNELVELAVERLSQHLIAWGYGKADINKRLRLTIIRLLIANYSPYIEDITYEVIESVYYRNLPKSYSKTSIVVSRTLAAIGILAQPFEPPSKRHISPAETTITFEDISQEWISWCKRWYQVSTIGSAKYRKNVFGLLMRAGRWLYIHHPQINSPEQWTREIALDWVKAIETMRSGDYIEVKNLKKLKRKGEPIKPRTKLGFLTFTRTFFHDCQEWGWIKRRFDPLRYFTSPRHLLATLGPQPRDIKDDVWAKLLWAGLNLEVADLPTVAMKTAKTQNRFYPLEMVRAVVIVWLFCGLRKNEIRRLRVGCISWQKEEVKIPGTNDTLPKNSVCYLQVPISKTSEERIIPVDSIVGEAIEAWEKVRPNQIPKRDRKTNESVHFLFLYKNIQLGEEYINKRIIPVLCRKAGVPDTDARGRITSHRARSTIATQLFNSKNPMSLFEIQRWLGHRTATTTQYYVNVTPTKLAKSFFDAEYFKRNVRTIEVLIDQTVVKNGLVATGEPWKYYDLGHGYCTYDFFDQCPHRMACAKCGFYLPKDSSKAQLLEGKANLQRMLQEIPLAEEERAAVEDGAEALEKLYQKLEDTPTPTGPTPREINFIPLSLVKTG